MIDHPDGGATVGVAFTTVVPAVADDAEALPLAPAVKTVWMIKLGIGSIVIFAGVLIYDLTGLFSQSRFLPVGVLSAVAIGLLLTSVLLLPRWRYRFWRYKLFAEELFIQRGVFNRIKTIVPLRRIQHLDVSQDIIEREFDLAKLVVHTAGTRSSDVVVPGLELAVAEQLRDEMKRFILEDAV